MNELSIPPAAASARQSAEIARVWIADGRQHVTLNAEAWEDPAAWGLFLVDLAKHIANAYEQLEGRDRREMLARIKEGFDAEWEDATDEPTGTAVYQCDREAYTNAKLPFVDRVLRMARKEKGWSLG